MTNEIRRNYFNAIEMRSIDSALADSIRKLVDDASNAAKTDEHGSWDFGIDSNRKRSRWTALNWDLYGFGNDTHSGKLLIVIQIRRSSTERGRYVNVRKNYFLVGTNEDDSTFAHPVESVVVHAAIRKGKDVILAVQDWIFGGDYAGMLRQGDIALIPMRRRPAKDSKIAKRTMTIEGSHELKASSIWHNGGLYAKDPTLTHTPGTHPVVAAKGIYKIVVGNRADFWRFAAPTVD